ncbi:DinB family protein [Nocardia sp. 004]|uniref:DinB family protein n=1 Tax=Nocardia sp. 004 TaxID=3385978 RepID=UPI00399F5508
MTDIDRLLEREQRQVEEFIRLYKVPDLDLQVMINHRWNVQDLLAHIVAWHESFALNLRLLATGEEPQPPRGTLRQVNREGVLALRDQSVAQLIRRLHRAQRTVEAHIHDESITLIPYRKPGTSYTRAQHLDVVCGHIHDHFWEVVDIYVKAKN